MRFWLTVLVLIALVAASLWRGGKPERIVAAAMAAAFALDLARNFLIGQPGLQTVDLYMLAVDSAVLMVMTAVALQANRMWPMIVAALQLVIITAHMSLLLQLRGLSTAYWGMSVLPIYPQFLAIGCGIYAHVQRLRRFGPYPDWRSNAMARG